MSETILKQALTAVETLRALGEYTLKKKGMDPQIIYKAGVIVRVQVLGDGDDTVHLVEIHHT